MPTTSLQIGVIGQQEFAKLAVMGSDGKLEVMLPMSDDEQRDAEVHRRNRFGRSLAIQVKVAGRLAGGADNPVLHIHFRLAKQRVIAHSSFWYFFAYLDQRVMQLGPTCFLIPSATFHKQALRLDLGSAWEYHVTATMGAETSDQWTGYRVARQAVGARLIGVIDELDGQTGDEASALSPTQKGVITVAEFAKLLMLGSDGQLEVDLPVTNDDERDVEVHQHGKFNTGVSFQIKGRTQLLRNHGADLLRMYFRVPADRARSDPRFWYFFAYLDPQRMGFISPCFVVPSQEVHLHALPRRHREFMYFFFQASMATRSADRWAPYRVEPLKVGQRVLEIVRNSARPDAPWRELKAS